MHSISSELRDGGQKVYEYFGFDCTTTDKQAAPSLTGGSLKASISFKRKSTGDYIFTVWTTGTRGDCVSFVQLMTGCTASQAIAHIRSIYGGTAKSLPSLAPYYKQIETAVSKSPRARKHLEHVVVGNVFPNRKAVQYFSKKSGGCITAAVLHDCGVSLLTEYSLKDEDSGIVSEFNPHAWNPFVAFESDECLPEKGEMYFQVKAPFSNLEAKTWRWLSKEAYIKCDAGEMLYSFGFKQVQSGVHKVYEIPGITDGEQTCQTVWLTEGESDCLALISQGIPSVTFGGGLRSLNDKHLKRLKGIGARRVVVVYDADKPGKEFSAELAKQKAELQTAHGISLHVQTLPKLNGTRDEKDVCDYLRMYGADADFFRAVLPCSDTSGNDDNSGKAKTNGLHNSLVSNETNASHTEGAPECFSYYTRRGDAIEMQPTSVGRHVIEAYDEIERALYTHRRVQLCAGTGTGKTYAAVEIAKKISTNRLPYDEDELRRRFGSDVPFTEQNFRTIVVLPSTVAVEQASNQYNVTGLCSSTEDAENSIRRAKTDSIVVTTYDSLHRCGEFDLLIVDEVHEISKAYTYRREAVASVYEKMKSCRYVLALTATPEPIITKRLKLHTLKINAPGMQMLNVREHYLNEIETAVSKSKKVNLLVEAKEWCKDLVERGGVAVVRHNSKANIKVLKQALEKEGITGVYSMTRDQKSLEDAAYNSIVTENKLPDDCKVMLCTCVLDTAVNIQGRNIEVLMICDGTNKDADNVVQFCARFRDMKTLNVRLLFDARKPATVRVNSAEEVFQREMHIADCGATFFNHHRNTGYETTVRGRTIHDKKGVVWNKEKERYEISEPYCISQAITDSAEKTSGDTMKELAEMHKAGITIVAIAEPIFSNGTHNVASVEDAVQVVASEEESMAAQVHELLEEKEIAFASAINSTTKDAKLKAMLCDNYGTTLLLPNDESEALCTESAQLLKEPKTEKTVRHFLEDLQDGFSKEDALTLSKSVSGSNSRAYFKTHLKALQCLHATDANLNTGDRVLKLHLMKIAAVFVPGERVSSDELRRRVVACGDITTLRIQEKYITSLVRVMFGARRVGERKMWEIGEIQTIQAFCEGYGIKPPATAAALPDTSTVYVL
jgi:hypothetical protein